MTSWWVLGNFLDGYIPTWILKKKAKMLILAISLKTLHDMYFKLYKILKDRLPAYSLQLQPHFDLRESKLDPYYIVFNKISIPQAVNIQLYTFIIYTLINLFSYWRAHLYRSPWTASCLLYNLFLSCVFYFTWNHES